MAKKFESKIGLQPIYSTEDPNGNPATKGEPAAQIIRDNFERIEEVFEEKADKTGVVKILQASGEKQDIYPLNQSKVRNNAQIYPINDSGILAGAIKSVPTGWYILDKVLLKANTPYLIEWGRDMSAIGSLETQAYLYSTTGDSTGAIKIIQRSGNHTFFVTDAVCYLSVQLAIPDPYGNWDVRSTIKVWENAGEHAFYDYSGNKLTRPIDEMLFVDRSDPENPKILDNLGDEVEVDKILKTANANRKQARLNLDGGKITLYGDSISSNTFPAYKTAMETLTGAEVFLTGFSGYNTSQLAKNAQLNTIFNYESNLIVSLLGANDSGIAGTVGTFGQISGEPIVPETDINVDYNGTYFIQAVSHIVRRIKAQYYNIRERANLTGTETEAEKEAKIAAVLKPYIVFCTTLPENRTNSSNNYSKPENWNRKRMAIIECCTKYNVPCIDLQKLLDWDMTLEPFYSSGDTTNNGIYTLDGIHPNTFGYNQIASFICGELGIVIGGKDTQDIELRNELYGSGEEEVEAIPFKQGDSPAAASINNHYYYKNQSAIQGKNILKIKTTTAQAGTFTILIGKNIGSSNYTYRAETFNVQEGVIEIEFNRFLALDEKLGIQLPSDTARVRNSDGINPVGGGFDYYKTTPAGWYSVTTADMGYGVFTGSSSGDISEIQDNIITLRADINELQNQIEAENNPLWKPQIFNNIKLNSSTPLVESEAKFFEPWIDGNIVKTKVPTNMKDRLILNDEPALLNLSKDGFYAQQEATIVYFKGKYLIYYTGVAGQDDNTHNQITFCYFDPVNKTIKPFGEPVIGLGIGGAPVDREANCSQAFVHDDKVYIVATDGYGFNQKPSPVYLYISDDGIEFSAVGELTNASIPWTFHGNNWIIPEPINGYYYWFYEGRNQGQVWQSGIARSTVITGPYENIGIINNLGDNNGMYGGTCVFYHNGKFRMFYHYGVGGDLPTVLGYAEAPIETPTVFTRVYNPLLGITRKPFGDNTDQIADPALIEIGGNMYMIAEYTMNHPYFDSRLYLWEADGLTFEKMFG